MIRHKRYCSHVYPVWDSVGKKHSWNIFTSIFMWIWHKILIFSTSKIQLFFFFFSLTKLFLFSLFCSIHLNYLNGAGNLDPEISLWSRTTSLFRSSIFKIFSIILNISLFFLFPYAQDSFSFFISVTLSLYSLPTQPFWLCSVATFIFLVVGELASRPPVILSWLWCII